MTHEDNIRAMMDLRDAIENEWAAKARLQAVSNHLPKPEQTSAADMAASTTRPFITCHVLNTVSGKPAANVAVTLKLITPAQASSTAWSATTNDDGRVTSWTGSVDVNQVVKDVKEELEDGTHMIWSLTFDTGNYFGLQNTFWPEIELKFAAKKEEEHYHVPLLLGPWSYTTYRGS